MAKRGTPKRDGSGRGVGANKGRGCSRATGKIPWNKGKKMSEEQKKKISETLKARSKSIDKVNRGNV